MDAPHAPTPPAIVAPAAPDPLDATPTALPLLPAPRALAAARLPAPFLWACFAGPGDRPDARDLDADGHAELLALAGGGVFVARNEAGQRCHTAEKPLEGFFDDAIAGAFGDLDGDRRADGVSVRRDGRIEAALADGKSGFVRRALGRAPLAGEARAALADADGDGIDDLYLLCGWKDTPGPVLLLRNHGRLGFEAPAREVGEAPASATLADLDGDGRADLVYAREGRLLARLGRGGAALAPERPLAADPLAGPLLAAGDADGDGRADLALEGAWLLLRAGGPVLLRDERLRAPPGAAHALADMDGDGLADLVTFTRRGACDVTVALSRPPEALLAATAASARLAGAPDLTRALAEGARDIDGDLLTDLEETLVFGTDPLLRDTDHDGLLDGWEARGRFRGVRLDLLGASPLRKDIFLELDVEKTADMARVERAREVMRRLYASAPVANPDGSSGIEMHTYVDTRIPLWPEGGLSRQQHREAFMTPSRAGIFHWMHLAARGGGGQADMWSDHGSCAGVFEATLPHEFGHQLGLNHGGAEGTNGVPIYPSLMNYAYNYQLEGRLERIDYSRGALAGLVLDESALSERVAVPEERLRYLAGPPFHFRLEPREEGKAAWVDWNRNGREDAGTVRENLNAAAGEGYGPRHILDDVAPLGGGRTTRTLEQPALVTLPAAGGRPETLALLYVPKEGGGLAWRLLERDDVRAFGPEARAATPTAAPADLREITAAADPSGNVHVMGTSAGGVVHIVLERTEANALTPAALLAHPWEGVPALVADGEALVALLRAPDGALVARRLEAPPPSAPATATATESASVESGGPPPGRGPAPLPGPGAGAEPEAPASAAPHDATAPSAPRPGPAALARLAWSVGVPLEGLRSSCPAALARDTVRGDLLLATSDPGADRMRISRLDPRALTLTASEPVGGEKGGDATNQRAAIVFETAPWLEPEGRIDLFVAGRYDFREAREGNCTHMYRCYTIGDRAWLGRGGWKCDQTWNEWTYTLSGVAAAWFHGRPWHAGRFYTFPHWDPRGLKDSIAIGTHADGVCDTLRDHDDWALIAREGLVRSLLHARPAAGRARD